MNPVPQKRAYQKWIKWLIIAFILLLLAGIGYTLWLLSACTNTHRSLENENTELQLKVDDLTRKLAAAETVKKPNEPPKDEETACKTPSGQLKANIKDALTSKNTAVFASYVSNPVKVVFAGSEKGGNEVPSEAAVSMEYTHSATTPWTFALPSPALEIYRSGYYASFFSETAYIGRSADGMVVSFDFDCEGKIDQIFVASNEGLLE